jgi:hypothetical protein
MALNLSAVVILGLAVFFLIKSKALGCGAALLVFLFGFFVAGTGAYHPIMRACQSLADIVASLRP